MRILGTGTNVNCLLLTIAVITSICAAQQKRTPAPVAVQAQMTGKQLSQADAISNLHPTGAVAENAAATHERFATFLAGHDFDSELLIQNLRLDAPVTVDPSLLLSGIEIVLDQITIPPHAAVKLDLNSVLLGHGHTLENGVVAVRYDSSSYGGLSAVVTSSDEAHHLYLSSVGQSPEEFWYGTALDAVVWAPDEGTEGYVALMNTTADPKQVEMSFFMGEKGHKTQLIKLAPHEHRLVQIDSLTKSLPSSPAGIRVAWTGQPGDVLTEGSLFNRRTGFSKYIRFLDTSLHFAEHSLRTHFLLLGEQPLTDGFPAKMAFRSVAAVRNVGLTPIHVEPVLKWLHQGTVETIELQPIALAAHESKLIDFSALQKAGQIPADLHQGSIQLVPDDKQNSIVAELFNFSNATHGYVVGPSFAAFPTRATGSIWRIDGTFQTTIIVENTATQNDTVTLKLFSGDEVYEKAFPVAAGGLLKINVKDLEQNHIPDKDGNLLVGSSGTLSLAGGHGIRSKLSFDKLIHSADESEYVGLLSNPCNFVTEIDLFFESTSDPYTFDGNVGAFWTDGSITFDLATDLSSANTSLATVSGSSVTLHPFDNSSHTVSLSDTELETACDICSSDFFSANASLTVPPRPACPSAISVSGLTMLSLASQFPALKTGIGAVASMLVSPVPVIWNGVQITEAVAPASTTCPASFGNQCSGSSTFTVGTGGIAFGQNFQATTNIFYDQHTTTNTVSLLDSAGINSCTAVCSQSYSCGGTAIAHFTITRSFTKGTIQNTPVTNVSVSKN